MQVHEPRRENWHWFTLWENVLSGTISTSEDGQVGVTAWTVTIDAILNYLAGEPVKVHIDPANIEL